MNQDIYKLLDIIEKNGYKAYIVGGYVRDLILGYSNNDIDIVTDAPINLLTNLFDSYHPLIFRNNTIKFKYKEYKIDIAQIRKEYFENGKIMVSFTSDLKEDYLRRDFTFNAIYLDKNNNYTDFDNCINDCKNLVLRFVSNPIIKCKEDPTRFFRAIYFILKYNIKKYSELLDINLDETDMKSVDINALNKCLFKILKLGKNRNFISMLDKCNAYGLIFTRRAENVDLKPIDFLINSGYIFIDNVID